MGLYWSPIEGLFRNFGEKIIIGLLALPLTTFMNSVEGVFLSTPTPLLFIVGFLWLLDLISGLFHVVRTKGVGAIESFRIRQTVVKLIEYMIFLTACDLFASTGNHAIPYLSAAIRQMDELGAIILAATELKSIDENLSIGILSRMTDVLDLGGIFSGQESD